MSQEEENEKYADQDLIDDFMGRRHWRMHPHHKWNSYHNDWNKLMPVIEKIESVDWGYGFSVLISRHDCLIEDNNDETPRFYEQWSKEGDTKITFTFKAVLAFAKWYRTLEENLTKK